MADWFVTGDPLTHLGQTMGRGLSSTSQAQNASTGGSTSDARNAALFEAAIAQQRSDNDRNYSLKKKEVEQQYKIAKLNAKTQRERNEIDRWYNQQQVQLAQERLAQDKIEFEQELEFKKYAFGEDLGFRKDELNRTLAARADEFAKTHGLAQGRLGYDVLNMAAQLRGPSDWFQAANFSRGVANDPNTAGFLNALKANVTMPSYGAQYGVPDPETLGSLSAKLGTALGPVQPGPLSPGSNDANAANDTRLNQIRGIYASGAHRLAPGALEGLTADEMKLLQSGIDAIGGSGSTFLDQYRRSRIGNRSSSATAA